MKTRKGLRGALVLIGVGAVTVGFALCSRTATETIARQAVLGCSDTTPVASARVTGIFAQVVKVYGEPTRETDGGNTLYFDSPKTAAGGSLPFWVRLHDDADPCHWKLAVHVRVSPPGPEDAALLDAIADPAIGRRFESVGSWYATRDGVFLTRTHDARQVAGPSLGWLEDHVDLASQWSNVWLEQVRDIKAGRALAPTRTVWRKGRDPKAILESGERLLLDAGLRGR